MNESAISGVDIEGSKAVLEDLLQKVVQDVSAEDIETLESIRKIYKKTIPFSKRMYVASYLLAQYMTGGKGVARRNESKADTPRMLTPRVEHPSPRPEVTSSAVRHCERSNSVIASSKGEAISHQSVLPRKSEIASRAQQRGGGSGASPRLESNAMTDDGKAVVTPKQPSKITVKIEAPIVKGVKSPLSGIPPKMAKVAIPEDEAVNIFISIGRGRRVFPRDLVGLLVNAAGVKRERIGDIRVLQSYSFVQMYKDDADAAIAKLNGYDYRGKQLSVSYSKDKVDGTEKAAPAVISKAGAKEDTGAPPPLHGSTGSPTTAAEAISSQSEIASQAAQGGTIAMTEGHPSASADAPAPSAPSTEAAQ